MSVKARSRNTDSTWPIIVIVALFISNIPELVLCELRVIIDNEEFGSCNCSACNVLCDQKVFVMFWYNTVGYNCTWTWVLFLVHEKSIINSFVNGNFCKLRIVIFTKALESFFDFWDFFKLKSVIWFVFFSTCLYSFLIKKSLLK